MTVLTWIGILFCLSQSAILSGLNLGLFARSKLELQVAAKKGDPRAERVLRLREDSNFALVTILWSNVAVNVLLALLSGSVLGGVAAFFFSTVIITIFAEIIPQSYFSRHAMKVASTLFPLLRVYQFLAWPVARPTAWVLDRWLGNEAVRFFPEKDLHQVLKMHMEATDNDIARVEGQGARNFLELDDISMRDEGELVDADSIIPVTFDGDRPRFPALSASRDDPFLKRLSRSAQGWAVLVDEQRRPRKVLRPAQFIQALFFNEAGFDPHHHCHQPVVVYDPAKKLGELIPQLKVHPASMGDTMPGDDVILLWSDNPRIVTGTDLLGRLLRGVAQVSGAGAGPR